MNQKALFSSQNPSWSTPQELFDEMDAEFGFTLDPCADDDNHKCGRYYTKEQDGLAQDWSGEVVFCNPPYGRQIGKWVEKAFREVYAGGCRTAVLLLPARTETKWFHDFIYHRAEIRFIRGRIRFDGAVYNAPFPSMVVIFRGETA
jgi:site-specific DNA-methyltransferase (adenine-specific)